ncbi:unnamed protein product [Parascedosporium putredinis]|uniref:Mitochondrial F1F0 ATP synthase subunit F Atp17 n=1 Tax=Parascedosporium putredinis TaxID=1442378 RepID=A0A9P1M7D6_9PEZI|nr:unnamed protein product [Parascedosporium putredinis]CAI7991492.1 unnamed protein product [Parascedosporium putredinis]
MQSRRLGWLSRCQIAPESRAEPGGAKGPGPSKDARMECRSYERYPRSSPKAIGTNPGAVRMQRVVNFYEKLPRGAASEVKATGLLGRYQAKHFGKNASAKPIIHAVVFLVAIGYAQNYYYHLRHHKNNAH